MQILKLIFEKIGTGLLYGIGFGLVMVILVWGVSLYFEQTHEGLLYDDIEKGECIRYKNCEESSGLALTISSERINNDGFILLGNVKNSGKIKWTSVKIKAELYDEENNFFDECSKYIDQKVSPDAIVNFKLSCSQCSKVDLDNYHSYKVFIIDGNTY